MHVQGKVHDKGVLMQSSWWHVHSGLPPIIKFNMQKQECTSECVRGEACKMTCSLTTSMNPMVSRTKRLVQTRARSQAAGDNNRRKNTDNDVRQATQPHIRIQSIIFDPKQQKKRHATERHGPQTASDRGDLQIYQHSMRRMLTAARLTLHTVGTIVASDVSNAP